MESITDASERYPLRKIINNRDCSNVYRFSCFPLKPTPFSISASRYQGKAGRSSSMLLRSCYIFCQKTKKKTSTNAGLFSKLGLSCFTFFISTWRFAKELLSFWGRSEPQLLETSLLYKKTCTRIFFDLKWQNIK